MSDEFFIAPYKVRSAGTDVPPEEVQAGINSLAQQTTVALNILSTQSETPTGPAGGDLSGTYPNPTVAAVHATAGTLSGVTITGSTVNSTPVGQTTPAAGAFTTLSATTPLPVASGGTGSGTASGARTNLGLGTLATQNANSVAITGGTLDNTPIGQTTPAAIAATTLTSTGGAVNGTVGATTANTGAFTTLAASGTVSGTGFSAYLASPPAIGGVTAAAASFTTLSASSTVSGTGFSTYLASPPAIGGTTAAAGSFTTLSATGAFTPSQTAGIVGTTTNNNANTGSVGEYQSATTSGTSIVTNTAFNATSISLTAGDWDVTGVIQYVPAASTVMQNPAAGISTTSATLPGFAGYTQSIHVNPVALGDLQAAPVVRVSIAATTTVYLVGICAFSTSTCTVNGAIRARRAR